MRRIVFALVLSACGPAATEVPVVTEVPVAKEPPATAAAASVFANDKGESLCPVMGEVTPVERATGSAVYEGKTYYFCCDACTEQFNENPAKFANGAFLVEEGLMSADAHAAHKSCDH